MIEYELLSFTGQLESGFQSGTLTEFHLVDCDNRNFCVMHFFLIQNLILFLFLIWITPLKNIQKSQQNPILDIESLRTKSSTNFAIHEIHDDRFKISVAIPVFNRVNFIDRLLINLLNQTYPYYEVVFTDDCSTDGSYEKIYDRVKNDKRVTLVRHSYNKGIFWGRRTSYIVSKYEYIISVDPDDVINKDGIENLMKELNNTKTIPKCPNKTNNLECDPSKEKVEYDTSDIYQYRYDVMYGDHIENKNIFPCPRDFSSTKDLVDFNSRKGSTMSNNLWNRMFKRTVLLEAMKLLPKIIPNKKLTWCDDLFIAAGAFLFANSYHCCKYHVYLYYRSNSGSSIGRLSNAQLHNQYNLAHSFRYFPYHNDQALKLAKEHRYDEIRDLFYDESPEGRNRLRLMEGLESLNTSQPAQFSCEGKTEYHSLTYVEEEAFCILRPI
ncbi:hypothetical protein TRFO_04157 [Tritrichomonas foetus]|uniref:Glycosyltransferase 2-like domain-containing protein n=1 Tax=Tritrichomonas foetus TaxID=1144522 RepID=A0A1J4KGW5_9EUKA|nr:hypothetical protein TRFO_04157 [Tritrichomonas foetus]|eukprot:OHT10655.1 hypothetical protein TRFO_04157 [Tritrichomonas foetus]